MSPSPKKIKHEMKKNLRILGKEPSSQEKRVTSKTQMTSKALKKISKKRGTSKRTSPGETITTEAAPAYVHKEGARWETVKIKKNLNQERTMNRLMNKQNTKRGKK